jgi:hypothetical protein
LERLALERGNLGAGSEADKERDSQMSGAVESRALVVWRGRGEANVRRMR